MTLLALLKHPLLRLGGQHRERAVTALERAVLRGPRPRAGSDGLAHALDTFRAQLEKHRGGQESDLHHSDPRIGLHDDELAEAAEFVAALARALAPLESIADQSHRLSDVAARHREVLAALSLQDGEEAAFAGRDGSKLADALDELATSKAAAALLVDTSDYVELFAAALADRVVRPPPRPGARVRILGTIEARLTDSDRVVLGGLVEGTWPPESRADAWLSRPMRLDLGLDLPERRVGLTAHDFTQLLGAKEVILSHAAKIAGTPTVPSRFIQRLAAVAGKDRWKAALSRGESYLSWARALDRPEQVAAAPQPAPKPPADARPKGLSVTDIEDWLRDPYTIYAKYILRLIPLDAVDLSPGAAERGTIIHAAIGDFTKRSRTVFRPIRRAISSNLESRILRRWKIFRKRAHSGGRASNASRLVCRLGEGAAPRHPCAGRGDRRQDRNSAARWCVHAERHRRPDRASRRRPLCDSRLQDRFGAHGKAGADRARAAAHAGSRDPPQRRFSEHCAGGSVAQVGYVLLKGGARPGEPKMIEFTDGTTDSQADRALQKLTVLAARFAEESEPYRSLVHPMWTTHYGDYDHLARVKEWSATGGEVDDIWGSE